MRISEIAQLKSCSPALRLALSRHDVYHFLREQVQVHVLCAPPDPCPHCQHPVSAFLSHPYSAPHIGWCIDCVLGAYFSGLPLYEPPEKEQPRAPYFVYDERGWTDQDGEPVESPFRWG